MKHHLVIVTVLGIVLMLAGPVWSLQVNPTTNEWISVGGTDLFKEEDFGVVTNSGDNTKNSNQVSEVSWALSVLGDSTTYEPQIIPDSSMWLETYNENGTLVEGTWALDFGDSAPDYFLIKTGNVVGSNDSMYFLFENVANMSWAVLDLANIYVTELTNIEKVSHLREFNDVIPAPEPGTLLLLGGGLIGLAAFGRSRRKS